MILAVWRAGAVAMQRAADAGDPYASAWLDGFEVALTSVATATGVNLADLRRRIAKELGITGTKLFTVEPPKQLGDGE